MSIRAWLLRKAMGRMRITPDIVRYLSTFQRLGENVEVQLPGELLPVGARTAFRAVRTRAAAQLGVDWVWPYWLERQLDPRARSFVPRGHLPVLTNVTHRNWTAVGNIGSPWEGIVDPRGLVTPWFDGWSLDWWIGADDRWHVPSREASVRQRLVDATPVVESAMRVPGGDAIHRAYGVADGDLLVVEIENASPAPFVAALAVRPYNPEGLAVVERIELHDRTVTVDGRPALLLPRAPARTAGSTFYDGDSANVVMQGQAGEALPRPLRCDAGLAQAAFLFPVPHRTAIQVAIPLAPGKRTRRRGLARRRAARTPDIPSPLPTAAAVARGWEALSRRGMQLDLPAGRLAEAVDANRRFLLLFHDGADITPGPFTYHRFWFRDAAYMVSALDRYGFHQEAGEVIEHFVDRQHADGFFFSQRQEWDANGAALYAMAEHWRLTGDLDIIDPAAVDHAVRWIERMRTRKRRRNAPGLRGLMPPSVSAEHLGPLDTYYWDAFWSLKGLVDGAAMLRATGMSEAAQRAETWTAALRRDLDASLAVVADRLGNAVIPAGPRRRIDPAIIGSLVACWPLELLPADHPGIAATAEAIRERFCIDRAFFQGISHTGLGTYLTMQLAFVELEAGDRRAVDRLEWLVEAATPTLTWPEAIHPQLGGGCMGDGHHGWAAADFLTFVRRLLIREVDGGLALCTMLPTEWRGQPLDVRDAPTHHGRLSFSVRWHGDRPALMWELAGRNDLPVRLTVPGLDPSWSSQARTGEALLGPVAVGSP
ncbi:MAG TPA: hypothetical protein VFB78_10145 [Acidimicrobiales bacterium]|nr:hypothetical protein [Acidimicrobiales bacterium]